MVTSPDDKGRDEQPLTDGEPLLGWLLDASHELPPDDVAQMVATAASGLGARKVQLYLVDVDQRQLVPVLSTGPGAVEPLDIEGTLAGRAFQTSLPAGSEGPGPMWFPVRDGADRLGVLRMELAEYDDQVEARARHLASLTADLVVAKRQYGDLFHRVRRRRPLGLAAEVQWHLLPPLTFSCPRVQVAGILEPAYDVAGDSFDYAMNGDILSAAVFDGVGHDLTSTVMTTVAVGAYRHARRRGLDLVQMATEIDDALRAQFQDQSFVTAALTQIDVSTGAVRWLNAGHPRPLLLRDGQVVRTLQCRPRPPLGILHGLHGDPEIGTEQLEPGDALLLFTDGVVEARSSTGRAFGFERLADFFQRAAASELGPPETLRRLVHAIVEHHDGRLQDDATCVLIEWSSR